MFCVAFHEKIIIEVNEETNYKHAFSHFSLNKKLSFSIL
jgi:hypothetical protein